MDVEYSIERSSLATTLRTGVGINTLGVENKWDYAAYKRYDELQRVVRASNFEAPTGFVWSDFWENLEAEFERVKTRLVVVRRINPFSPSTYLTSFFSDTPFSPSNTLNVIVEPARPRLDFDRSVCAALVVTVSDEELHAAYAVMVKEMIVTRGLRRD